MVHTDIFPLSQKYPLWLFLLFGWLFDETKLVVYRISCVLVFFLWCLTRFSISFVSHELKFMPKGLVGLGRTLCRWYCVLRISSHQQPYNVRVSRSYIFGHLVQVVMIASFSCKGVFIPVKLAWRLWGDTLHHVNTLLPVIFHLWFLEIAR